MTVWRLSSQDPGSYSNPDEAVVSHTDIDLVVDFSSKILRGYVTLTVNVKSENAKNLILDSRDLHIKRVSCEHDEKDLKFAVAEPVRNFGNKLTIELPADLPTTKRLSVRIDYETDPRSTALQWLTPEQTAGGRHPYLFSQCQPDHCRSIVPCQDSPGVKGTYAATITVAEELVALMSAVRDREPKLKENGEKSFFFSQTVPIPAYLIALAVGDLESREIGPRSRVWSEPQFVDRAMREFAETELFLKTAEDICGPYVWKIYDILVLPPSFPFGGMENPCLTFITPTLLAGDKSLVSVIAHEISHSWSGNLVSVKNFEHFWLNEGITTFLERKINGRVHGEPYRHFCALGGLKDLRQSLNVLGDENILTKLVVDLTGVDPDEAFSTCPYEKGHTFLFYLERLLGTAEKFEAFLRAYFDNFKYQSIDTDDFKNFFSSYFAREKCIESVDWDLWLFSVGMPPIIPEYDSSLQRVCKSLANRWCECDEQTLSQFTAKDLSSFMPQQVEEFCALLLERTPISSTKLKYMNDLYDMNSYKNCEIRLRWLRVCIRSRWEEQIDAALTFATAQGRMKYVRPIFRDLFSWDASRETAARKFVENKSRMMNVLVRNLENDFRNTSLTTDH